MTRAKDISKILTDADISGNIDVDGTTNLDVVDVDGAVNFAADVTFADGADIITASAGTSNFRAGVNAGNSITSGGNYNTVVGDEAGTALSTGDFNTFIGYVAGDAIDTSSENVAIGANALTTDTKGSKAVAVGKGSLGSQNFSSATDSHNTAVGYESGKDIITGTSNTIIGGLAGSTFTTGLRNTLVGANSGLALVTSNSDNTFMGQGAGAAITSGDANTIIGRYSGNAGGIDIRTSSNQIVISDGDGTPRMHVKNTGNVAFHGQGRVMAYYSFTIADDASLTILAATAGGNLCTVYDQSSGSSALFHVGYDANVLLSSKSISGKTFLANDVSGNICVFSSGHTVTLKNRTGGALGLRLAIFGSGDN